MGQVIQNPYIGMMTLHLLGQICYAKARKSDDLSHVYGFQERTRFCNPDA